MAVSETEQKARRDAFLIGVISAAVFVGRDHGEDTIARDLLDDHEIKIADVRRLVDADDDIMPFLAQTLRP